MKPFAVDFERWRPHATRWFLACNALALVLVAVWFRARLLENIPGTNADEAWYGVQALEILEGRSWHVQTPTGNPPNPFFLGPVVFLHTFLHPSMVVLRLVAVLSGMAALALNWWLCRWVFDLRTATISTVLLAVLPINIAYSRFAWDASQSVAATLPVLYFSLAAVRFDRHRGRWIAAATAALVVAMLVHPTNVFAGAAIAAAVAHWVRWKDVRRIARRSAADRRILAGLAAVAILAGVLVGGWLNTSGPSRFTGRMGDVRELIRPRAAPHFSVLYARLFTGATVYHYIPGSHSWLEWPRGEDVGGWGIDVALFWTAIAAAVWFSWRSWKGRGRMEDRVLVSTWALGLAAFLLIAGTKAMIPGWERFALCLIAPAVVLTARGAALCFEASSGRRRLVVAAAASLAGWLLVADYRQHYFAFIEQTGGRSHPTFSTAAVEPKQAALRCVLRHRDIQGPSDRDTTWIVTTEWWNYWPLRYLGMTERNLRVVTPEEVQGFADYASASRQGRVWYVEFSHSDALRRTQAALAGRKVRQWEFADYSGRTVLSLLREE